MKVLVCPKCGITPDIMNTELKCPKCGRTAVGNDLNDTVTKWNNGELAEKGKEPKVVIKDEEIIKKEAKAKEKPGEWADYMNEPVTDDSVNDRKPVRRRRRPE